MNYRKCMGCNTPIDKDYKSFIPELQELMDKECLCNECVIWKHRLLTMKNNFVVGSFLYSGSFEPANKIVSIIPATNIYVEPLNEEDSPRFSMYNNLKKYYIPSHIQELKYFPELVPNAEFVSVEKVLENIERQIRQLPLGTIIIGKDLNGETNYYLWNSVSDCLYDLNTSLSNNKDWTFIGGISAKNYLYDFEIVQKEIVDKHNVWIKHFDPYFGKFFKLSMWITLPDQYLKHPKHHG